MNFCRPWDIPGCQYQVLTTALRWTDFQSTSRPGPTSGLTSDMSSPTCSPLSPFSASSALCFLSFLAFAFPFSPVAGVSLIVLWSSQPRMVPVVM